MKITRQQLRRIIKEAIENPKVQEIIQGNTVDGRSLSPALQKQSNDWKLGHWLYWDIYKQDGKPYSAGYSVKPDTLLSLLDQYGAAGQVDFEGDGKGLVNGFLYAQGGMQDISREKHRAQKQKAHREHVPDYLRWMKK
jgi:hypothetical protein